MQGLQAALRLYFQDGVDAAMKRHQQQMVQPVRAGALQAIGPGVGVDVGAIGAAVVADALLLGVQLLNCFI